MQSKMFYRLMSDHIDFYGLMACVADVNFYTEEYYEAVISEFGNTHTAYYLPNYPELNRLYHQADCAKSMFRSMMTVFGVKGDAYKRCQRAYRCRNRYEMETGGCLSPEGEARLLQYIFEGKV